MTATTSSRAGGLLKIGPTGTNVNGLNLALIE
jgi:glycerate-2-kinase